MKNTQPRTANAQTANDIAFGFVQSLATELSLGRVDLPSFPEIALRVRRVLLDSNSSPEKVVRVVGSEPALAARLLRIANSASFNRGGKHITDLRTAINRMGYDMVRSASMSFAMAQMRNNKKLVCVKHYLDELWQQSTLVAAFASVLARTCTKVNPDEALLTGMMQGIGKLYVLTRVADHPALFADPGTLHKIVSEWHTQIGKAILENWEFSDAMVQAVGDQNDFERIVEEPDLSDIVAVAILMAAHAKDADGLIVALHDLPVRERLGLDARRTLSILKDFEAEIDALRGALSV